MFRVLFICTDNIGRSLTAKYLYEDWLKKNGREEVLVSSAGTHADSDISAFAQDHREKLQEMGIDTSDHVRTQLTRELLEAHDLALVMDEEQRAWTQEHLGAGLPLYSEVYKGESSSLHISVPGVTDELSMRERMLRMVDHFQVSIPVLAERIDEMMRKKL
jgi:protein-tyrosine-phosphatase